MFKAYDGSMFGTYQTQTFADTWPSAEAFTADIAASGLTFEQRLTEQLPTLFYLLFARYGNSHFANMDINQSRYKVFSTIWMYGPAWAKELELQQTLRNLTDEQLEGGNIVLNNTVLNEGTVVDDPKNLLSRINNQNASITQRGAIERINSVLMLLKTDVTENFLDRFKFIFGAITTPSDNLVYEVDETDDDGVAQPYDQKYYLV